MTVRPTDLQRSQVQRLAGELSEHEIAELLEISRGALRKHFAEDLANGRARRRAEIINLLWKSARAGSVAALSRLERLTREAPSS